MYYSSKSAIMKHVITFLCSTVFVLSVAGQQKDQLNIMTSNLPFISTNATPSSGETTPTTPSPAAFGPLKSTNGKKYRLDSITSDTVNYYYTYDDNGNITSQITRKKISASEWTGESKMTFGYDVNDSLISRTYYLWDTTISQWRGYLKYEWSYNEYGFTTSSSIWRWDDYNNQWIGMINYTYVWDIAGNMTHRIQRDDYLPDSNKWVNYIKEEMVYDTNNNKVEYHKYMWDDYNKVWDYTWKEEKTYNSSERILSDVSYKWNSDSNRMVYNYQYTYSYDTNGNEILKVKDVWDNANNQWVQDYKKENSYDADTNHLSEITYSWNADSSKWIGNTKDAYNYNANNYITKREYYTWNTDSADWRYLFKEDYTYDANGKLIEYLKNSWNYDSLKLAKDMKYEYLNYDSGGHVTHFRSYLWDADSAYWKNYTKRFYEYDSANNLTLEESYIWDGVTYHWKGFGKEERIYDHQGDLTFMAIYDWDDVNKQWIGYTKREFIYDYSCSAKELIANTKYSSMTVDNKIDRLTIYQYKNDNWQLGVDYIYHYTSLGVNDTPQEYAEGLQIYPNPADDYLMIATGNDEETLTIELYNIQGSKVLQREITGNSRLAVGHLNKGSYVCRVKVADMMYIEKVMIE